MHAHTGEKSQFERARGTLGTFDKRGMLLEADLVWRDLATACRVRFPRALSPRKKPPRQRQSLALPCLCSGCPHFARSHPLSRPARRFAPVLQPRRMRILTKRGSDRGENRKFDSNPRRPLSKVPRKLLNPWRPLRHFHPYSCAPRTSETAWKSSRLLDLKSPARLNQSFLNPSTQLRHEQDKGSASKIAKSNARPVRSMQTYQR